MAKTEEEQRQASQCKWLEGLLADAQKRKWFGTISIKLKRGMIDVVLLEESLKPPADEDE